MKIIINAHKATPQEATQFTNHLLQVFPITTKRQIVIEFRTGRFIGRDNWGLTHHYPFNDTLFLEVALGTRKERRDLPDLLQTLAHEYCHALQYDQGRPADCDEANRFGDREAWAFLKKREKEKKKVNTPLNDTASP